jgi:hypothetical protein
MPYIIGVLTTPHAEYMTKRSKTFRFTQKDLYKKHPELYSDWMQKYTSVIEEILEFNAKKTNIRTAQYLHWSRAIISATWPGYTREEYKRMVKTLRETFYRECETTSKWDKWAQDSRIRHMNSWKGALGDRYSQVMQTQLDVDVSDCNDTLEDLLTVNEYPNAVEDDTVPFDADIRLTQGGLLLPLPDDVSFSKLIKGYNALVKELS